LPFEFPIPLFDERNKQHQRLAELAAHAEKKTTAFLSSAPPTKDITPGTIGHYRGKVRDAVRAELDEIDSIVTKLLS
jgi:hypothetical protein